MSKENAELPADGPYPENGRVPAHIPAERNGDRALSPSRPARTLSVRSALGCLTICLTICMGIFAIGGFFAGAVGLTAATFLGPMVILALRPLLTVEDVPAANAEHPGVRQAPLPAPEQASAASFAEHEESFAGRPEADSFWESLTAAERRAVQALAQASTFPAGAALCREGHRADHVIILRSGWTKVCVERSGRERIVAMRGPGDLVGERASLGVRSRSATVIALDTVQALLIATADFAAFIRGHPRVLSIVEEQVYGRLTEEPGGSMLNETADLEQRIAALITDLLPSDDDGLPAALPVSDHHLASWADASPHLVKRVLLAWRSRGVIRASAGEITVLDRAGLEQIRDAQEHPGGPATASPSWTGQNCTILLVDIAGFGALERNDADRRIVRATMYRLLRDAFDSADIPWTSCHREDRGDGALIVIPPSTPTAQVAGQVITRLAGELGSYNHRASAAVRIQLRAAIDVGPVVSDSEGVCSDAIVRAARLLEAPVLKQRLAGTAADLGTIASTFVYDTVIANHPIGYKRVKVQVKEAKLTAWMRLSTTPH